ncbi:MAG: hypothetical protein JKY25_08315 [Robiginitomaculum sp.]|nr:hypothetical protein [Robiginitomaculum sp.]
MSIMMKKIRAGNGLPASYTTLKLQLTGLYEQLAAYLENSLEQEIGLEQLGRGPVLLGALPFDEIKKDITGLLFAVGGPVKNDKQEEDCQVLVEISKPMAKSVIKAKLGSLPVNGGEFSLLDFLIMQPIAELVLDGLNVLGGDLICEDIIGRAVSVEGIADIKFARSEKWMRLYFPMSLKESQKTQKKPVKGKQANKDNNASDELGLTLYIARPIAEILMRAAQEQQAQPTIDPDDPWAQHMRSTMLSATRSLEIVIEDLRLSIASCTRLEPGQIISLPGASHERLNIKTRTDSGHIVLAAATLGAFKAHKAVKLNEDIDPAFLNGLEIIDHNK